MKNWLLFLLVALVYAVHQDCWNWLRIRPLLFGFLPVGLAYHVGYTLLASATLALLVKYAWPAHLEDSSPPSPPVGSRMRDRAESSVPSSASPFPRWGPACGTEPSPSSAPASVPQSAIRNPHSPDSPKRQNFCFLLSQFLLCDLPARIPPFRKFLLSAFQISAFTPTPPSKYRP
jgi:hypothetical protein